MRHLLLVLVFLSSPAFAGGVYQTPEDFIAENLGDEVKPELLWLDKNLQSQIDDILGHPYKGLRLRYWRKDSKTVWVLEEIGKEKPITTGFVINDDRIEKVRILIFRESRGWEVRHSFFTDQFREASLKEADKLDRSIDNISGATLSVRAVTKLARLALFFHRHVSNDVQS